MNNKNAVNLKVIMLGPPQSGKTSLLIRFVGQEVSRDLKVGLDMKTVALSVDS